MALWFYAKLVKKRIGDILLVKKEKEVFVGQNICLEKSANDF